MPCHNPPPPFEPCHYITKPDSNPIPWLSRVKGQRARTQAVLIMCFYGSLEYDRLCQGPESKGAKGKGKG